MSKLLKRGIEVKPYQKNAKRHPDAQLKQIANSLKEFGWRQPIVTDKEGTIIVGHGRWMAYQKYLKGQPGVKGPWIVTADDLTPAQVKAYRLADNKTNESDWDMTLAIEELKELNQEGYDITLTGFDKDLLIEPDDKDDVIPENAPTRAKLGDLWALGEHRVLCGDSTDKASVERLMGDRKADLYLTDPPYNVALGMNETPAEAKKRNRRTDGLTVSNDEMSDAGFHEFLVKAFQVADDVMKAGAVFYIWHADSEGYNYGMELDPKYCDVIIKRWEDYTGQAAKKV